ncbi:MAG: MATE family efflux transporter [Nanoarchaeota archaeon]|nr:MATE family efflux transporter [Nanoarchaeota archaeon]
MSKNRVAHFIKNPRKALFKLALPIFAGMMVQAMYNIVDTAFVGRLGAESIAALTFSFPLFFVLIALNSGIGAGMNSRISRFLGEKKKGGAENAAMHGILLSTVIAIIFVTLSFVFLKPMFILFGATGNVLGLSLGYMSIVLAGMPFMFIAYIISSIFSGEGDTVTPTKVQVAALVLNIILDPIFIYGFGYGVKGAAIATVISFIFALVLSLYFISTRSYLKIERKSFRFSYRILWQILSVGAPASVMTLLISFYVLFINRFMSSFGTNHVASFGIVSRLESLAIMPIVAFSISLLTLVGMFYGAKRYELLRSIIWYGVKSTIIITSLVGAVFFIAPSIFLRIFTSDYALLGIAVPYLRIDVFTFPLMAFSMVISRALQGMGHGMPGLVINLIRIFVVALPLAFVFVFIMHLSYLWIAVAMVCGGVAASTTAIIWLEVEMKKCKKKNC